MSKRQLTLEQSLKPFFGDSKATAHFVAGNYFSSVYDKAVNSESDPASLMGTVLENIMYARNYTDSNQYGENDVHRQFIDFIVRTALFHKAVDPSKMMGSVGKLKNVFDVVLRDTLNKSEGRKSFYDNMVKSLLNTVLADNSITEDNLRNLSFKINLVDIVRDIADPMNNKMLDVLKAMQERNTGKFTSLPTDVRQSLNDQISNELKILVASLLEENGVFRLNKLREQLDDTRPEDKDEVVEEYLRNKQQLKEEFTKKLQDKLFDVVKREINKVDLTRPTYDDNLVAELYDRVFAVWEDLDDEAKKFYGLHMHVYHYQVDGVDEDDSSESPIPNVPPKPTLSSRRVATTDRSGATISSFAPESLNDSNPNFYSEDEMENFDKMNADALENWFGNNRENISAQQRGQIRSLISRKRAEITNKNLEVSRNLAKSKPWVKPKGLPTSKGLSTSEQKGGGWYDTMKDGYYRYPGGYYKTNEVRVNLVKEYPGSDLPRFGATLAWLPVKQGLVGKLHFTNANGLSDVVNAPEVDSIREIYRCVYLEKPCVIGGQTLNLPTNFDQVKLNKDDFNLDYLKIIHKTIRTVKEAPKGQSEYEFSTLFEDMATHIKYGRDQKGLYRFDGNQKIYESEEKFNTDDCAGSGLTTNDKRKCVGVVADCLIRGNNFDLSICLEQLADKDMFEVAVNELEPRPDVAVKILKTFGVREGYSNGRKMVETYESWLKGVVSGMKASVRDTILSNENLLKYLQGVIAFVNRHPVILNEDLTEDSVGDSLPSLNEIDSRMEKRYLYIPPHGCKEGKVFEGSVLRGFTGSVYATSVPSISSLPYTNAYVGPSIATNMLFQQGGTSNMLSNLNSIEERINRKSARKELSSGLLVALMQRVFDDLKDAGMELNGDDKKKIHDGIEKVKIIEEKTFELYRMLRKLADLLAFFKASGCTSYNLPREVSVRELRNKSDALSIIERNVVKLQSCIDQNNSKQLTACNSIVDHIGKLFEVAGGKTMPEFN